MKEAVIVCVVLVMVALSGCDRKSATDPSLKITIAGIKENKYGPVATLVLEFKSNVERKLVFDWAAFSKECGSEQSKEVFSKCGNNLQCILDAIAHSQIVIENKKGEMLFFTEKTDAFFNRPMKLSNCAGNSFKYLQLKANESIALFPIERFVSDLKPHENDDDVRLHYLFKPTQEQRAQGYKPIYISSNWFQF
jgi:hypothetical protein